MLKKINHIGVVVRDFEEAQKVYSKGLGMKLDQILEIPDVQLKIGVLKVGMEVRLFTGI
jgi:catechol 2,3-dioxygenase-like lactoylglutathione lyase family enzyme